MKSIIERQKVGDMGDYLIFVSDSLEVESIHDYLGIEREEYGSFFVSLVDGDYGQIWGLEGIVPYLHKAVYRLQ